MPPGRTDNKADIINIYIYIYIYTYTHTHTHTHTHTVYVFVFSHIQSVLLFSSLIFPCRMLCTLNSLCHCTRSSVDSSSKPCAEIYSDQRLLWYMHKVAAFRRPHERRIWFLNKGRHFAVCAVVLVRCPLWKHCAWTWDSGVLSVELRSEYLQVLPPRYCALAVSPFTMLWAKYLLRIMFLNLDTEFSFLCFLYTVSHDKLILMIGWPCIIV